ncbi:MAG: hypothetical protein L6R36_002424 [Xanthoria steineri]|nr:MAG: hypothetical protein L6R36_002424 [Xanthoria steineri]
MAQNSNQTRPPGSFPSPHSYPSPSMSAYAYPPSNHNGQSTEPYRASPTGSSVSLPSLNLPPIRTIDGRPQSQQGTQNQPPPPPQQQQQQQQHPVGQPQIGQPQMNAPLPPPMNSYYPGSLPGQSLPPPQHMNVTSDPNQQPMRYALPAPDGRMMSGGRHKKEIKRRTKTGCLTCRKRRIKCDEAHPACRNCQKSKRDCLGYDPIFKSQPGPTAIQPAPSAAPSMQPTPSPAPPYPPPPQGYVPASPQSYTPPNLVTSKSSPNPTSENPYDYHATIDPALASSLQAKANAPMHNGLDFRQETGTASPYASSGITENSTGKRSRIDELVAYEGDPSYLTQPLAPTSLDNLRTCIQKVYCTQIDRFLETQWFFNRALDHVLRDARLTERINRLISLFAIEPRSPAYEQSAFATRSLEAGIIWAIMSIARRVTGPLDSPNPQISPDELNAGVLEAAKRVNIFETLLIGQYLDTEVAAPMAKQPANGTTFDVLQHQREHDFWRLLHKFLTIRDNEASASNELDRTLNDAKGLLDLKENRDVMYSIAVVRLHGARESVENVPQPSNRSSEAEDKLLDKAKTFLEGQTVRGTNQVVQRVCGMASKAWTLPR